MKNLKLSYVIGAQLSLALLIAGLAYSPWGFAFESSIKSSIKSPKNQAQMQKIDAGNYRPLYLSDTSPLIEVGDFYIDKLPVTNREFFLFVEKHPRWSQSKIPSIFTEKRYLQDWIKTDNLSQPATETLEQPVTSVSWFAAQAYCKAQAKRLPTVAEWEYVASANETKKMGSQDPSYNQKILDWYSRPNDGKLANVGQDKPNYWGVQDLHGLIWEWSENFNSTLVSGESRADSSLDSSLFCGAGAAGASDPSDYAAFMRFAFRSSLQARFALPNLGFRCAASPPDVPTN